LSINRIDRASFLSPFQGPTSTGVAGSGAFSDIMRAMAAGNPSREEIKTFAAYLQMRMNDSLMRAMGGGQYISPLALFGRAPALPQTEAMVTSPSTEQVAPSGSIPDIVERAASTHNVDPALISAVIKAESNGSARATSPKGAMGLMQLMPATARDLGVTDPYDPEQNVMAGTKYLKMLLKRYDGNRDLAVAAYNWGLGNLEKSHRSMPRETVEYVARIKKYMGVQA
jgi:soluble lytic murein transglycosylase-like protein